MRTVVFIDGQNLYHLARTAWAPVPAVPGSPYGYPSYDVQKLAQTLCARDPRRSLTQVRFYTGVPAPHNPTDTFWHDFWSNKLRFLGSQGIYVYRGRINPGGQEKGVDVSIAVDLVALTYDRALDCAVIVSQDHDLGPAVGLSKRVAKTQRRFIVYESAFPYEHGVSASPRGVPGMTWVHIDRAMYDACRDHTGYRMLPQT